MNLRLTGFGKSMGRRFSQHIPFKKTISTHIHMRYSLINTCSRRITVICNNGITRANFAKFMMWESFAIPIFYMKWQQQAESSQTMVCQMRIIISQMCRKRPCFLGENTVFEICPNKYDRLHVDAWSRRKVQIKVYHSAYNKPRHSFER